MPGALNQFSQGLIESSQQDQQNRHSTPCLIDESEVAQSCPTLCDPWTVAHQTPPSMGFSRPEYWSGLPFPSRLTEERLGISSSARSYLVAGLGFEPRSVTLHSP